MTVRIPGSVALVTGASSGIGAVTAETLAQQGATVVTVARRVEQLEAVTERCRRHAPDSIALPADVSDEDAITAVVDKIQDRFGQLDVVINNAGTSMHVPAPEMSIGDIRRLMDINFFGAVHTTMAALPGMLDRRRGAIINVTSVAGYIPNPNESAYGASKAALSHWTHGLAVDLHGTGVHAGVVSPGPIDTEIWEKEAGEAAYDGKLYPPQVVADGIVESIEQRRVHATVPRHYGAIGALYHLFGKQIRKGLIAYERKAHRDG